MISDKIIKSCVIPSHGEIQKSIEIKFNKGERLSVKTTKNIFYKLFGTWYVLPKGLISDGGSIPLILGAVLKIDPFDKRIIFFSLIHDYAYRTQFLPRFLADAFYATGLIVTANKPIAVTFYLGLRLFGLISWRKNQKIGLLKFPKAEGDLKQYFCDLKKRG